MAHFLSKALCEKANNTQHFLNFPHSNQLPVISLHIHKTYLLSIWVPLSNFRFGPLSSGWWRYLHHLRGQFDQDNFLLTTTHTHTHKIEHSIIMHYTTQHNSNTIKKSDWLTTVALTNLLMLTGFPALQKKKKKKRNNKQLKCNILHICNTTMKYVWTVTNTYNNLCAQLWGYIIYNDKSKNINILLQSTSHKGTNTITQTKTRNKQHTN